MSLLLLLLLHTLLGALLLLLATRTSEALEQQLRIARVHRCSCLSIQRVRASVSIGSSRGGGDDRDRVQRRRYVYHGCTGPLMAKRRTTLGKSPSVGGGISSSSDTSKTTSMDTNRGQTVEIQDKLIELKSIDWESQPVFQTQRRDNNSSSNAKDLLLPAGFQSDLDDFRLTMSNYQSQIAPIGQSTPPGGVAQSSNSFIEGLKSAFTTLLIADFFVVIVFLVWFLAAAVLQSSYPVVLERFQDVFQPVVVPALTVLMVGSIASGALESASNRDKSAS